jgi:predicted outer membrane repeat protein
MMEFTCAPVIESNLFIGNHAGLEGGAIQIVEGSSPRLNNNIFFNNTAKLGGAVMCVKSSANLVNNTFCENSAETNGGGLMCKTYATLNIFNTIFWNNHRSGGPLGKGIRVGINSSVFLANSLVEGGQANVSLTSGSTLNWGAGMIDADPLFVNQAAGDLHLRFTSPCKDTGDSLAPGLPDVDFEGNPRTAFGLPDMGADEFHPHLYCTGEALPGNTVDARFVGLPGDVINGLVLGENIFDPPLYSDYGKWYLNDPMHVITGLGILPPAGVSVLSGTIPQLPIGPYTVYLQAVIDYQLTGLCALRVD